MLRIGFKCRECGARMIYERREDIEKGTAIWMLEEVMDMMYGDLIALGFEIKDTDGNDILQEHLAPKDLWNLAVGGLREVIRLQHGGV